MIAVGSCGHNCDDERIYHKQINTLVSNGYKVKYFTYCEKTYIDDEHNNNIEYQFFNSTEISQKQYKTILYNILKNDLPEIFHIHDMELLPVASKLKKNFPNVKIIYDVHEDLAAMWDTFSSYPGMIKRVINYYLYLSEKRYLSCVDYFILASRYHRDNKYKEYSKIKVIENFPMLKHIRQKRNIQRPHKLVYHGQLSEERGIITLVNAFNQLCQIHPSLELILIGNSRTEDFQKKLMQIISENNRIKYISQIPHNEIWTYLEEAHIGILPVDDVELFQYNTPTKLFEYMATNCGIVASELRPIKGFCNQSASWSKPGDMKSLENAIRYYIENPDTYNEHKKNNFELINGENHWENISGDLLNIYKDLLH